MPLFDRELNELADRIGRSNLAIWLHTAAPTNGSPTNGRTTVGGGGFASGVTLLATGISNASSGDITNNADINFGQATAVVGTVAWWSALRGADAVAFGTLPSTVIGLNDSFKINAGTLDFNGSTS